MDIPDLRRKADSGNVAAQAILGSCYLDGIDVEINYGEAFRLLSAAAGQGASRAVANLARMYAEGLGIPKNLPEAIRLYEAAAKAGEFFAQFDVVLRRCRASGPSCRLRRATGSEGLRSKWQMMFSDPNRRFPTL
jgi:TPR repeat protein